MSPTTKAQRLADTIRHWGGVTPHQVADELLRLEARVAELEAQELAGFEVIDQHGKSALFLDRERATDYAAQHKAVARFELVRRKPSTPSGMVDEAAMARLRENGRKAWAFLGDRSASDWVDEIRGNERQDCEPVAYLYHDASAPKDAHPWLHSTMLVLAADRRDGLRGETPLYAAPPKREPLSEDEIKQIEFTVRTYKREPLDVVAFASAIERAHGIKGQS